MKYSSLSPILGLFLITGILSACSTKASSLPDLPKEPIQLEVMNLDDMVASEDSEVMDPPTLEAPTPLTTEELAIEAEKKNSADSDELEGVAQHFTEEGRNYMREYLLEPSEDLHNFVDEDMMSRCGSGASYELKMKPTEENPYFFGTVNLTKGCGQFEHFFDFRVSPDGLVLEISDVEQNNYIPYKEWFKTAKPIEFDPEKAYQGGA